MYLRLLEFVGLFCMIYFVSCVSASLQVYVVPAITDGRILPDTSISASYLSEKINISAAKGEYEPASFVVRSDANIPSLEIETTDLSGTGGTIPASNVDIRSVKVWWQAGYEIYDLSHKHLTPELLLKDDSVVIVSGSENYIKLSDGRQLKISDPAGVPGVSDCPYNDEFPVKDSSTLLPVNLPKNYNKQFWVTVKVPDNTAAGNYSGKVYLKDGTQTLGEIDLNVNVLPFKLSASKLEYGIYYGSVLRQKGCISSYDRNEVQYWVEQEDMYAHGVIAPTIKEQWVYDGNLNIRKEAGTSNRNIYHWGLTIDYYGNDVDSLKEAIQYYKDNTKPFGTENYYIYGIDEKNLNNPTNRAQIQAAHEAGAKVFCAEYDSQAKSSIADVLDLLVASGTPDASLAAKYHSYGHRIFSYSNPQGGEEKPETYRRNYGLLLWQKDYDGAMDFAYQWSYSNIWNDFDNTDPSTNPWCCYRDHNFVYPTVDGVIDTVQWEGFREGVDDVRYLSTLLEVIEEADSKGVDVSSTQEWVSDLKGSDLSNEDLDDVRSDIAAHITTLLERMTEVCCNGVDDDGDGKEDGYDPDCAVNASLAPGLNSVCWWTEWDDYGNNRDYYSGTYSCPAGSSSLSVSFYQDTESSYDYLYFYDGASGALINQGSGVLGNRSLGPFSNVASLRFRFTSDSSVVRNGVKIHSINCSAYAATTTTTSASTTSSTSTSTSTTTFTSTSTATSTSTSTTTTSTSTTTSSTTSSTTTSTSTTLQYCVMPGNSPPCGEVTVSEVVEAISRWAQDEMALGDVIDLLNSWADPSNHPPN